METRLRWELVEKIGAERQSAIEAMNSCPKETVVSPRFQQILGIRFFDGDVETAVAFMFRHGGFLVAPSGSCFARPREDEPYRRAILAADLAIADSGLMVLIWQLLRRQKIRRISGLRYLQQLLAKLKGEAATEVFWVLPRAAKLLRSRSTIARSRRNTDWKSKIDAF